MRVEFKRALAQLENLTNRRYQAFHILLENLTDEQLTKEVLNDLRRFVHDIEEEIHAAKRKGNREAQMGRFR